MLLILSLMSSLAVTRGVTSVCQQYNGQCGTSNFQIKFFFRYFWKKLELKPSWNQDLASRMRTGSKAPNGYWGAKYGKFVCTVVV
ncbi:hypothetical protein TELCIR_00882 [Teladorsagia circumcincta]|uniref:Secreted protein n=1 Tax=Teladorsagia circumcincta TaxID=45464 RepID=A0A2G9V3G2_TELCI|nr:hypothetical protein TELCIR_00882 [Teladorsagia circumcincta]